MQHNAMKALDGTMIKETALPRNSVLLRYIHNPSNNITIAMIYMLHATLSIRLLSLWNIAIGML